MSAFEKLVAAEVESQIKILLPSIKEEIKTELQLEKEFREVNQVLFSQTELAARLGVSTATIRNWRKLGLESEPNPTGGLLFDIHKVSQWRHANDKRKVK